MRLFQFPKVAVFKCCYFVLLVLFLTFSLTDAIEGQKRKRRKKKDVSDTSLTGVYYCMVIMALTVIPSLGLFIYSIYKDPMTPTVFTRVLDMLKERTIGYLSSQKLN